MFGNDPLPLPVEPLDNLVRRALGQGRVALRSIRRKMVARLRPRDRVFAAHVADRLESRDIFVDALLRDLHTLLEIAEDQVAASTTHGFVADDESEQQWFEEIRDEDAQVLGDAVAEIRRLIRILEATEDLVDTLRHGATLFRHG